MTDLKSVSAPAISEAGVKRLIAFARPSRLKNDCTLFDAGYEQCKQDLMLKINAEVIIPAVIEPATRELSTEQMQQVRKNVRLTNRSALHGLWPW